MYHPHAPEAPTSAGLERELDRKHGPCIDCKPKHSCERRDYEGHLFWTGVTGARSLTRDEFHARAERMRTRPVDRGEFWPDSHGHKVREEPSAFRLVLIDPT